MSKRKEDQMVLKMRCIRSNLDYWMGCRDSWYRGHLGLCCNNFVHYCLNTPLASPQNLWMCD